MHAAINTTASVYGAAAAGGGMAAASALWTHGKADFKMAKKVLDAKTNLKVDKMSDVEAYATLRVLILLTACAAYYPTMKHRDKKGNRKTDVYEISPCDNCGCRDLHLGKDGCCRRCYCLASRHARASEEDIDNLRAVEFILQDIAGQIYKTYEHLDSDDIEKKSIYDIQPCDCSSCPCMDYRLKKRKPTIFSSKECVCSHRPKDHQYGDPSNNWYWIINRELDEFMKSEVLL